MRPFEATHPEIETVALPMLGKQGGKNTCRMLSERWTERGKCEEIGTVFM